MARWFLKRMFRVKWTKNNSNENILIQSDKINYSDKQNKKKTGNSFDHIMRREKMEHHITTGKIDGKRLEENRAKLLT